MVGGGMSNTTTKSTPTGVAGENATQKVRVVTGFGEFDAEGHIEKAYGMDLILGKGYEVFVLDKDISYVNPRTGEKIVRKAGTRYSFEQVHFL
jgi:subtilisin family serine protease